MNINKKLILNAFLIFASICIALILAEISLRVIDKPKPTVSGWRSNAKKPEKNQMGFRGQPINYSEDDFVVVLLGDSQVEANACSYKWMPERRLEHFLSLSKGKSVKVFTIGTRGYGQDQQFLVMKEYYQKYRADLVVLWLTPGNDVWNNVFPTHWPSNGKPKPTFWIVDDELHGPNEQIGDLVGLSNIRLIALVRRFFFSFDRDGEWEKYLPSPYKPLGKYKGLISTDWQDQYNMHFGLMPCENLDNEKSHLTLSLDPVSPRTKYGLNLTRMILHEIEKIVNAHKGEFVTFYNLEPLIQISKSTTKEAVPSLNGKHYKTSWKQLVENVSYINEDFRSFNVPISVNAWRVGPEDLHLNEHATDQVMEDLAFKLESFVQ